MSGIAEKDYRYHCIRLIVSQERLLELVFEESLPFLVMFAGRGSVKARMSGMLPFGKANSAQIAGVPQRVLVVI